jgi:hypothetical protein
MNRIDEVIGNIRWQDIEALQGHCANVPTAIRSLQSDDPKIREAAYWDLDNHVVVQGGLFEGAFFVIPFLLNIVRSKSKNGHVETLDLLIEIAAGSSQFDKTVRFRMVSDPFLHYLPESDGVGIPLPIATRFAVANGLSEIVPLIASNEDEIRGRTRDLLLCFPEFASELSQRLRHIVNDSCDQQLTTEIHSLINELCR